MDFPKAFIFPTIVASIFVRVGLHLGAQTGVMWVAFSPPKRTEKHQKTFEIPRVRETLLWEISMHGNAGLGC